MARHLQVLERAGHLQYDVILIMNEGIEFHSPQDGYDRLYGRLENVQAIHPIKREDEVILIMKTGLELYKVDDKELHEVFKNRHAEIQEVYVMTKCPSKAEGEAPFWIGQTQVTQALWEEVMGSNPSKFKGARKPVECVSWEDSVKFANVLSRKLGLTPIYSEDNNKARLVEGANGFRLPFDAEWVFAARGGEKFEFAGSDSLDGVGWYGGSEWCEEDEGNVKDNSTHDVAQLKPNAYGLYDMSGNVWEWCSDDFVFMRYRPGAILRVQRGGSWDSFPENCAVTFRHWEKPSTRLENIGLRLSR